MNHYYFRPKHLTKKQTMKAIIITILGVGVIIGGIMLRDNSTEFILEREIETIEVKPDWATDEDAVQAAKDVIRRKELEAERAVIAEEIKQLRAREMEIEKELGF
jgi:hypothetical protein